MNLELVEGLKYPGRIPDITDNNYTEVREYLRRERNIWEII